MLKLKNSRLYAVLILESWFSHSRRHQFLRGLKWLVVFSLLGFLVGERGQGLLLIVWSLALALILLEFYFRSYYLDRIITNNYGERDLVSFTVGRILYQLHHGDLLRALLESATGKRLQLRLGLSASESATFLRERSQIARPVVRLELGRTLFLRQLVSLIFTNDKAWADFLFRHEIQGEQLLAAVDWVTAEIERGASAEKWWSRARLERIPGLAKDSAYGATYRLDQYCDDLLTADLPTPVAGDELRELETVLARSREANALLVGPVGLELLGIVAGLAAEIKTGRVTPVLEGKRLLRFRTATFLAQAKDKNTLEQELIRVLNEAEAAGNVILVIDDLVNLLLGAEVLAVNLTTILDPYLSSHRVPIIALTDEDNFHQNLFNRPALLQRFEKVAVRAVAAKELPALLAPRAEVLERGSGVWFTYPALQAIARGVERYFAAESPLAKGEDLLIELVPWRQAAGGGQIAAAEVNKFLESKTSIPSGVVGQAERDKLLALEETLGQRIIGQTAAVKAVANALRRNRAGVRNPDRPIGSFLFLGPTGVGKTETAKGLAAVWFGDESKLLRLDMSEYQAEDALNRLIGRGNQPGVLSTLFRQNPYGVLLLDEFEKTNRDVLNLFLQILDEGFFSDMLGKRVNARNLIFIATSNAAADFIWQLVRAGADPATRRDELLNRIIEQGIFRPELLNRFDELVIFHPLNPEELKKVARLLLEKLAARLESDGYHLLLTDQLINTVATRGADEKFGARPMRRFIQDQIEQVIADKILRAELKSGGAIAFDTDLHPTIRS